MRTRRGARVALVLVLGAVSVGCSSGNGSSGGGGGSLTIDGQKANDHGTKDISGETFFSVEVNDFFFSPTVLEGTPGQKLTLDFRNEGSATHNISVDASGIDHDIGPSEETDVDFTIPDSGEVVFYCKFHKSQGMIGEVKAA